MIIFFGPPGVGKSVQGQLLAARYDWRWLSVGQILRDTHDAALIEKMQSGNLVESSLVESLVEKAILKSKDMIHIVLDGFPRQLEQAKWLVASQSRLQRSVIIAIVLEAPAEELSKRLELRARIDDAPEVIDERISLYRRETDPILNYFKEQNIRVVHVDGTGMVNQVHNRVVKEIEACKQV